MPATITVQGATPAGVMGSGFSLPYTVALAISEGWVVPQGEYYLASSEPLSLQVQTAAGVYTTVNSVPAGGGCHAYSDGSNVIVENGATAGTLTVIPFRGR